MNYKQKARRTMLLEMIPVIGFFIALCIMFYLAYIFGDIVFSIVIGLLIGYMIISGIIGTVQDYFYNTIFVEMRKDIREYRDQQVLLSGEYFEYEDLINETYNFWNEKKKVYEYCLAEFQRLKELPHESHEAD